MKGFSKSTEMAVIEGAIGYAVADYVLVPRTPQILGNWTDAVIGVGLFILGLWIGHDGIAAFLIGAAISYLINGIVILVNPSLNQSATLPALSYANAFGTS